MNTRRALEHWWSHLCDIATCWQRKWNEQLFWVDPHTTKEVNLDTSMESNSELQHYKPLKKAVFIFVLGTFVFRNCRN